MFHKAGPDGRLPDKGKSDYRGMSKIEVLDRWDFLRNCGTQIHDRVEQYLKEIEAVNHLDEDKKVEWLMRPIRDNHADDEVLLQ